MSGTICACGGHAFAAMARGMVVLVSAEDAELLQYRWTGQYRGGRVVAVRRRFSDRKWVRLPHLVLAPLPGMAVDHRDCDPLNNQRGNLRHASVSDNNANRRRFAGKKLPKGVHLANGRYRVMLRRNGVYHDFGRYSTPEEAAQVYADAAKRFHGEFARAA